MDSTVDARTSPAQKLSKRSTWCTKCVALHGGLLLYLGLDADTESTNTHATVKPSDDLRSLLSDASEDKSGATDITPHHRLGSQKAALTVGKTSTDSAQDLEHTERHTTGKSAIIQHSRLLDLPSEIRLSIYSYVFETTPPESSADAQKMWRMRYIIQTPALLHVCSIIRREAYDVHLKQSNISLWLELGGLRWPALPWLSSLSAEQRAKIGCINFCQPGDSCPCFVSKAQQLMSDNIELYGLSPVAASFWLEADWKKMVISCGFVSATDGE
ncbi:hypothetical protein LTR95_017462 [Oleoguttula sp. CCFEE 5521]